MKRLILLLALLLSTFSASAGQPVTICSFNIKFVGLYKTKENDILAKLVSPYDIVVVQEMVAPPISGTYPDKTPYTADPESAAFAGAMAKQGYAFWLSEEDTGTAIKNHNAGSATEWFIVFFRTNVVVPAKDLPNGFVSEDRSHNPTYDRVPYAFSFRTQDKSTDFVLVSVHLHAPSPGMKRRQQELTGIYNWVKSRQSKERDYFVLGDMNIQSRKELVMVIPEGVASLNQDCLPTNLGKVGKPFDHVFFFPQFSASEIGANRQLRVLSIENFVRATYPSRKIPRETYPTVLSDHNPVVFHIQGQQDDD